MNDESFRRHGHELVDWIADYLEHSDRYPVLARVRPGEIRSALPGEAPEDPEPFDAIMADFERVFVPGPTHWNHPRFFAYFTITASPPGVLGEFLSAALNQQATLWRTSPAATELEQVTLGWLRKLIGLPEPFEGVIYDTASIATLHALAAARESAVPGARERGLAGRPEVPRLRVYCSDETHSSIDKAAIAIGLGHDSVRKIPVDDEFRLRTDLLAQAVVEDRRAGMLPIAVVATVGTTATTSIDPVPGIADICARERIWLHVDAAYGGVAAMLPSHAHVLAGGPRRFARRQPAQMAVHAVRSERLLLPSHGCPARDVLAHTGLPPHNGVRSQKLDGHRRAAWPPLPLAETLDDPAFLRRARDSRTSQPAHSVGAAVCRVGGRARRFRAPGARPVQRRVLPLETFLHHVIRCRAGRRERAAC